MIAVSWSVMLRHCDLNDLW